MASAGMDRSIHIWDLNPDQTDDENVIYPHTVGLPLTNHKNSILNLKWGSTESNHLYSCGAINGTSKRGELFQWDLYEFKRTRQYMGHKTVINSIDIKNDQLASASDDTSCKIWDSRAKDPVKSFDFDFSMTSIAFSSRNEYIFCGGIDNQIHAINLKQNKVEYIL